jgi:hypothetical protein
MVTINLRMRRPPSRRNSAKKQVPNPAAKVPPVRELINQEPQFGESCGAAGCPGIPVRGILLMDS